VERRVHNAAAPAPMIPHPMSRPQAFAVWEGLSPVRPLTNDGVLLSRTAESFGLESVADVADG
jgi:hypothetical protein